MGTFSKGMQQRLGLGAALLGRPELVLLDEPTSALDPLGRADIRRIIRTVRDRGSTVFLNSTSWARSSWCATGWRSSTRGGWWRPGPSTSCSATTRVRIRATGLARSPAGLAAFGPLVDDGDWLAIQPIVPERIPDLVAAIVAAGGRIHAVEPGRATLEARFLGLMGEGRVRRATRPGPSPARAARCASRPWRPSSG